MRLVGLIRFILPFLQRGQILSFQNSDPHRRSLNSLTALSSQKIIRMAEPLSFVASIIAVSALAGNVATKGYRYIKAVKDCPEDVRKLMAEVNVLCGILNRLTILLRGSRSAMGVLKAPSSPRSNILDPVDCEDSATDSSRESEDEAESCAKDLGVPGYTHECRKTLEEIQDVLDRFAHSDGQPSGKAGKSSRLKISSLRRVNPKDLKWPLSSLKTTRLIEQLERYKSICTMALAGDGLIGIHAVLEETKCSNKYLAEIKAKQERMVEIQLTQEECESTIPVSKSFGLFLCLAQS